MIVPREISGHLVLSPHPDDAAWSLGARIAHWRRQGSRVVVITVFDGPDTDSVIKKGIRALSTPPSIRRAEDHAAMSVLDTELQSLGLLDAPARRSNGSLRYPTVTRLFGTLHPDDFALINQIAEAVGTYQDGHMIVHSPLAAGGHVDHRITRLAAEETNPQALEWYEDFPYTVRARHHQGLDRRSSTLDEEDTKTWIEASRCYVSQARLLFGSTEALTTALRTRAQSDHNPSLLQQNYWTCA